MDIHKHIEGCRIGENEGDVELKRRDKGEGWRDNEASLFFHFFSFLLS